MSTALQRTNSTGGDHRIEGGGFARINIAPASSIYSHPELPAVDRKFPVASKLATEDHGDSLSSSTTSSIGKNSDDSTIGVGGDGEEVQSEYKRWPLDSVEALEETLPIRKSISKFYNGKSRSFTSLMDASACPSIDDITKPENEYTRKRKNFIAFNNIMDMNRNSITRGTKGGISKRPNSCRNMLALAVAANAFEANSGKTVYSYSSSPVSFRPPLPSNARLAMQLESSVFSHADKLSSWRSFSLSNLQGAGADEGSETNGAGS